MASLNSKQGLAVDKADSTTALPTAYGSIPPPHLVSLDFSASHDTKGSSKSFPKHETRHVAKHKNVARCARFNPNGRYIGSASVDTLIKLFEQSRVHVVSKLKQMMLPEGRDGPVRPLLRFVLVELVELQDREVGDGTTSVVIIAAKLLKRANDLVRNKIHPTSVISGYRLAMRESCKYIEDKLGVKVNKLRKETLVNCAKTSMSSKKKLRCFSSKFREKYLAQVCGWDGHFHLWAIPGHALAFGESRTLAIANMVLGLKEIQIRDEIRTNVDYTIDLLHAPDYRDNKIHTGWLDGRIAMRVRAKRPPWYLLVVGGALYKAAAGSAANSDKTYEYRVKYKTLSTTNLMPVVQYPKKAIADQYSEPLFKSSFKKLACIVLPQGKG
ncbi:acetyl-CoA carboxylase 1 [Tanacetum coccineum]